MADRTYSRDRSVEMPNPRDRMRPDDPDMIRADIGETRRRMSHALDEIGERINPQHLTEQVKHNVREATIGRAETMARHTADRANDARHTIFDTIRDNPVPAAMTGFGLGWLLYNGRKHTRPDGEGWAEDMYLSERGLTRGYHEPAGTERFRDRSEESADRMKHRAEDVADRTREGMQEARERTREKAEELAHRAEDFTERTVDRTRSAAHRLAEETRDRSHRLEDRFEETLRTNPLAVGAAAAAIGLAVGLTAPTTRREAEMMGDTRDRLFDRAREATSEAADKVGHIAEETMHQASETAKDTAREEGLTH